MTNIILTRGVPASGKSTWACKWVTEAPQRARVNRDQIRADLGITGGVGTHEQEGHVTAIERSLVKMYVSQGYDVVVDATHLRARNVKEWLGIARDLDAEVSFADFPISFEEAVSRDAARAEAGQRSVGKEVVKMFFDKFIRGSDGQLPTPPELDAAVALTHTGKYVPDTSLPTAYGFDLDGSLAHMEDRGPYDTSLYHTDTLDENLAATARTLHSAGHAIIVLTGRSSEYREVCEEWLLKHGIPVHTLLMRAEGDTRNDGIIKSEIFDRDIAPFYNFVAQFDDRNRVVQALRNKGISVYQVAEGNF